MYDLIIIGGGPAAISAGIYAARKKLKTILICQDWGGQAALAPWVENYPGFEHITGLDLVNKMVNQLKKNELEIKTGLKAKEISLAVDSVRVKTENSFYQSRAVIIAAGCLPKKLGLPKEEKFIGQGISYCATCDAPLFKDKKVAVIGGGNAGLGTAFQLTAYASKIYLLGFSPQLTADKYLQEKVKKNPRISILTDIEIKEIKGEQLVNGLVYQERSSKKVKEIALEGIFIAIGSIANSSLVKNVVELNKEGEIKIDSQNRTSQANIFAAGDVTDVSHKQIVVGAGEGAKAALSAYQYLCQ